MAKFRSALLTALLAIVASTAGAQTPGPAPSTDPVLEARVNKLSEHLRCLVCQNQSIAESQAELANDLRRQVREMLVAGKSDAEIAQYMVDRYGDFVLYDPPVKGTTALLWGGPLALLVVALGGFAWTVRARRKQAAPTALSAEEQARAEALLATPAANISSDQENKNS